jgi:hypothetical protein
MSTELRVFWLVTYAHWDPTEWHGFGGEWYVHACAYATRKEADRCASVLRENHPQISGPHYQRMESIKPPPARDRRGRAF